MRSRSILLIVVGAFAALATLSSPKSTQSTEAKLSFDSTLARGRPRAGGLLGRLLSAGDGNDSDGEELISDDGADCDASGLRAAVDKCSFVRSNCGDIVFLIDYLDLYYCHDKPTMHIGIGAFLVLWLVLMISLLATTADYYFVPALDYMSFDVLRLSPEVAGITLLAVGNGAPDVFGALAGIDGQDDFQVVLGALLGASIFISSVVLGAVLLVAPSRSVDKSTFQRDSLTYMATVATIVGIAYDGNVSIWETVGLLTLYILYVTFVVVRQKRSPAPALVDEPSPSSDPNAEEAAVSISVHSHGHVLVGQVEGDEEDLRKSELSVAASVTTVGEPVPLAGLEWPGGQDKEDVDSTVLSHLLNLLFMLQMVCELPFTLMRWASCPTCDKVSMQARV